MDNGDDDSANHPDLGAHLQPRSRQGWEVHRGQASLQLGHDPHSSGGRRHIQALAVHVILWYHHQDEGGGKLLAHSISCLEAINLCVSVQLNADMAGKSWQEWVGFLKARGGKKRVKSVKVRKAVPVATNVVIEDDVNAVLGDQRALSGSWSKNYINRAVLVGTRIYPDSNASIKAKRPKYWDSTEGERDSF